jgi:hypothetical protein
MNSLFRGPAGGPTWERSVIADSASGTFGSAGTLRWGGEPGVGSGRKRRGDTPPEVSSAPGEATEGTRRGKPIWQGKQPRGTPIRPRTNPKDHAIRTKHFHLSTLKTDKIYKKYISKLARCQTCQSRDQPTRLVSLVKIASFSTQKSSSAYVVIEVNSKEWVIELWVILTFSAADSDLHLFILCWNTAL